MTYKEIVSITGLSGLYHLLTTKSDGAIVRNIGDNSTKFISARKHNVTPLDSIEVYTTGENIRLNFIFQRIIELAPTLPPVDVKVATKEEILKYFNEVYAELDHDRVYLSDLKKMLKWYALLSDKGLLQFEDAEAASEPTTAAE